MMKYFLVPLLFILLSGGSMISFALPATLSINVENIYLPDAIRLIANFLKLNVIISPSVQGTTNLHLSKAEPLDVLDLLLTSHGLAKWQLGHSFFIAPQEELQKLQLKQIKWQEIKEATSPLITEWWVIRYAKAEKLAHLLQDEHASLLSKRGRIRVDARTNVIGIQDTAKRVRELRSWMHYLDQPVRQILIEARLVSVDDDYERELGIHFAVDSSSRTEGGQNTKTSLPIQQIKDYSLAIAKLADGSLLDVKLMALESAGHADLISSPTLFTSNEEQASIEAGEEVPYQQTSDGGGTAVVFKKAVVGLKVTPHILPGNKVLLRLQINQDRPSNKMILGMPTISTRQMMTSVIAKDGQTIVLGGIYETAEEKGSQGLPFLSRIPLLGWLFKQHHLRRNKRELLIFVKPKIMMQNT